MDVDAGCRAPRPADAPRTVVVSHPYASDAGDSPIYEVLQLSAAGALHSTGVTFAMRAADEGVIAFTPDGRLGFAAQRDGTVGVFSVGDDGGVQVVNPALGGFYARAVVMAPDGSRAYVLDAETLNNGGGVYAVDIACDGTLGTPTKLGTFNTPSAMAFLHGAPNQAVVAGGAALGSPAGDDTHLVDFSAPGPTAIGSAALFPDGGAIASDVAVTPDDAYALVADNGLFAGNRVGVVRLGGASPSLVDILPTANPVGVVSSPFGNAALVLNSDGMDGLTLLSYDPTQAAHPFTNAGALTYVLPKPQLPSEAVVIQRGGLIGRVLIGELLGVRQVQFLADGGALDLSVHNPDGDDLADIVGAMGVQP